MQDSPLVVARARLKAYIDKDRNAIEALLAADYRFSSPIDNQLDRDTYLSRCWPNSQKMEEFNEIYALEDGTRAYIVYEAKAHDHRFRNSEVTTAREGKIVAVEVYFGWDLPHKASMYGFIENDGQGHA